MVRQYRVPGRACEARRAAPEMNFIADFAAQIPIEVIGNLLDVPRPERSPLRGWSLAILSALEQNGYAVDLSVDGEDGHFMGSTEEYDAAIDSAMMPCC